MVAKAAAQALRDRPGFIVHNLGKIRLQDYGPIQVDAFSLLPPHNPDAATLTFATMNGRLVYALCGEKYEGDRHSNLRWISLRQGYRAFLTGGLFEIV